MHFGKIEVPRVVIPIEPELGADDFKIDRYEMQRLHEATMCGSNFVGGLINAGLPSIALLDELQYCMGASLCLVVLSKNPDTFLLQALLKGRRVLLDHLDTHPKALAAYRLIYQNQGLFPLPNSAELKLDDVVYLASMLYLQTVYVVSIALRVASMRYYKCNLPQAERLLLTCYETEDHFRGENRGASERLSALQDETSIPLEQQLKMRCDCGYRPIPRQHERDPLFASHDSGALFVGFPDRSYDLDFNVISRTPASYPGRRAPMTVLQDGNSLIELQYVDRKRVQRKLLRRGDVCSRLTPSDSQLGRSKPARSPT